MNAIDTNVLVYSYDTRDARKQRIAQQVIMTARPFVLLWQVGCEFMAASRKLRPLGFTQDQAWRALADIQTAATEVTYPEPVLWPETQSLQGRHSLSFWDALLVAACIRRGIRALYTEDMGAPRMIDGLSLINPF
ncbi:MAG TPA: PIN domain-containing protein [Gemmataceae bacterium]|nr:PIN domain-containing protein [Gemmataceae bacterium]